MIWGSVVDAYDSFDPDYVGDAGPIVRSIAVGPVDNINWLVSSQRLLIGGDLNEYAARSSSLDEPLTPTAFTVKRTSSQGSASIQPVSIDSNVVFVNRTTIKIFENTFNTTKTKAFDFSLNDLCQLVPEIGSPEIVRMTVQRQPDTRIHCVRSDGTVALLVLDKFEDVLCWCEIETEGEVEDAIVLPAQTGVTDDYVYYIVKRVINNQTVRYLEKWAQAANTIGGVGEVTGTTYQAFSAYAVAISGDDSQLAIHDPSVYGNFYLASAASDTLWVHPVDSFPSGAYEIDPGVDPILSTGTSGAPNYEGTKYWLTGNGSTAVRCVDLETETTTTFEDANYIIMGAIGNYLIVSSFGSALLFQPNFVTPTLGASESTWTWPGNSISNTLTWDANGWGWQVAGGFLYRFKPGSDSHTEALPPGITAPFQTYASIPVYDSIRNAILIALFDESNEPPTRLLPGIWRYTGWVADSDSQGTWERVATGTGISDLFRAIWHDADSDTIFGVTGTGWQQYDPGVRRFTGDGKFIDYLFIDLTGPDEDITAAIASSRHVYYKDNCGWLTVTISGLNNLMRICYNGDPLLVGPEGDNLQPGGSTGRLHDLADSYINYSGTPITAVTGLDHLEGEEVVVWANGYDLGTTATYGQTYTVSGGQITLAAASTNLTVGLPYVAKFQSSKLGLVTQQEVLFGKEKRITHVALVLADTHAKGIRFGPDFTNLDDRPENEGWTLADADRIDTAYDTELVDFPGEWETDTRICLQAQAPRPCTVLAVKLDMEV